MSENVFAKIDINQNEYFDKGLDIIQRTRDVRRNINKLTQRIANADFRLSQKHDDEMWLKMRDEDTKELLSLQDEEQVLKNELYVLSEFIDFDFYKLLLQNYGNVLAQTSQVKHVEYNLHDEFDLNKAIQETSQAIFMKAAEFEQAVQDNKEFDALIASAQIKYYRNDLKRHHWGVDRLENIDKKLSSKGKSR